MLKNSSSSIQERDPIWQAMRVCSPETITRTMAARIRLFFEKAENGEYLNSTCKIIRIAIRIHHIDILGWLSSQKDRAKTYWCGREQSRHCGFEMAGIGLADVVTAKEPLPYATVFDKLRSRLSSRFKNLRYYGGFRFYDKREVDKSWGKFGSFRFIIPKWEIYSAGGEVYFACNIQLEPGSISPELGDNLLNELDSLHFACSHSNSYFPHPVSRMDTPNENAWQDMIERSLEAFETGELQKVVLARKSLFSFAEILEPLSLLRRLKSSSPNRFYFYFQPVQHVAFLGGSIERLYCKENRMLKSEAIAGTRRRGQTVAQDAELAKDLLQCDKDLREHNFVVENIKENLNKLCHTVDIDDEITILKLSQVQHLRCRLQGILAEDISDAEILQTMHPTPAVGGSPTEKAIAAIKKLEPFDRGWYAAPIGWVSHDASEFAVGIRSGLVAGNKLALYSGAGIVKGSTPKGEWAEIENKIANFMNAIMA